jgi:hypothetical protein
MARHRHLALFVAVLAITASLLVASPAAAQDLRIRDARHDYWHDHRSDGDPPDQHPPDWGDPDIRRTVYRHAHDNARIRIRMARLARGDGGYWEMEVRFRTNEGLRRKALLFKPFDGPAIIRWSGHRQCRIEHSIDYARDVFVLVVPRRCLGLPKASRVQVCDPVDADE